MTMKSTPTLKEEGLGTLGEALDRARAERDKKEARTWTEEAPVSTRSGESKTFSNFYTGPEITATGQLERYDGVKVGMMLQINPFAAEHRTTKIVQNASKAEVVGFDTHGNAILSLDDGQYYVTTARFGNDFFDLYPKTSE